MATEEHGGEHREGEVFDPAAYRPTGGRVGKVAVFAGLFLAAVVAAGVVPRILRHSAAAEEEREAAAELPHVAVARVERSNAGSSIALPGSIQPLQETRIYARANGYVRKWLVDIGTKVTKGQVLVQLEVPDIDEELRQAQATAVQSNAGIAQAKTNLELANTTNRRYSTLGPTGVVTQQEVDQYQAAFDAQQSNLAAAQAAYGSAQANVERLRDLKNFGVITAPFDGVITSRTAEIGQLVTAGTGMGQPLFKVAEVDIVRIFVNVPQTYVTAIVTGMDAPTSVREMPGRAFPGKVARTAHELDMSTRTLLTEVDIPNPDGTLLPGMYATVAFDVRQADRLPSVPASAVVFDARGTRVALVQDSTITWRKVEIDADMGDRLALSRGVAEGDIVVAAPGDRLTDGLMVDVEPLPAPAGGGAQTAQPPGAAPVTAEAGKAGAP